MTDRIALITGASEGIGAELARIFAANGHRVAIVARREDKLRALATELVAEGAPEPLVIVCDLGDPQSGEIIAAALRAADVEPDYVVNNAGFGLFGEAADLSHSAQLDMITVNIRALTDLSLRFSESLRRHRGGVLNVGSVAGFLPGPRMAVYYATKAYVLSFSEALFQEMRPSGVRVTALCPGPVPTGFQQRAGFLAGSHSALLQDAHSVALAGYRGLMAGRRLVIPGLGNRILTLALRGVPRGWVVAAVSAIQRKRR
jgi:short-subunit dehydrogenase